jgi:glutamyl-tRNA synthetase
VGTARTALFNYLFARQSGGKFVLRIEDTDQVRSTAEAVETIFAGLRWLELDWDEGPEKGGPFGPYLQSERLPLYDEQAQRLLDSDAAYECFCTAEELSERREQMLKQKQDPKYDGRCRSLTATQREELRGGGRRPALRLRTPQTGATSWKDLIRDEVSFGNALLDDFVIRKSDGFPTYNFAVVVDDATMAISHVIRGEDGLSNTPRQLLLYEALGYQPPLFGHVPLLLGTDRSKLSKRHGATSLEEFRQRGVVPDCMLNFLALLGWSAGAGEDGEIFSREELIARFELSAVNKAGAVFDHEKLEWMNGCYLRALSVEALAELAIPVLVEAGLIGRTPAGMDRGKVREVLSLTQERVKLLSELPDMTRYFFTADFEYDPKAESKWLTKPETGDTLRGLIAALDSIPELTHESLEEAVRELAEQAGLSAAKVIHPCRVAVTGRTFGPGLFELMVVLGKAECVQRLRRALDHVQALQEGETQ